MRRKASNSFREEGGGVRIPAGGTLLDLYDVSRAGPMKPPRTLSAPMGPDSDREHRGHALAAHRCHAHALHLPPAAQGASLLLPWGPIATIVASAAAGQQPVGRCHRRHSGLAGAPDRSPASGLVAAAAARGLARAALP